MLATLQLGVWCQQLHAVDSEERLLWSSDLLWQHFYRCGIWGQFIYCIFLQISRAKLLYGRRLWGHLLYIIGLRDQLIFNRCLRGQILYNKRLLDLLLHNRGRWCYVLYSIGQATVEIPVTTFFILQDSETTYSSIETSKARYSTIYGSL